MSESAPLAFNVDFTDELTESDAERLIPREAPTSKFRPRYILVISVVLNVVSIAFVVLLLSRNHDCSCSSTESESYHNAFIPPGIDEEVMMPVQYGWEYYADRVDKMEEVDRNWAAINPDVGWVSIPHEEFSRWGVISDGDDPRDPGKKLHVVQSYHLIHCLKVIRHTMLQLASGEKLDIRFGHSMHCLASLLRNIICSADNPVSLGIPGNDYSEYQYVHQCRNWAALSRWASERTSCMRTNREGMLDEDQDFENCSRTDGIIVPTLPNFATKLKLPTSANVPNQRK